MARQPTLHLMVGLPGAGKTTEAKRLEAERSALRLSKDERMKALYGDENPSVASDVIEGRLIGIALRALELGQDAVLDFGLWSRDERSALRYAAARRAASQVHFCTVGRAEQHRRINRRLAEQPHTTWPITEQDIAEWEAVFQPPTPGEVEGSEPIGAPPAGFADWDAWRAERWPAVIR